MVHYYLLIATGNVVDANSGFYKVGVGATKRDYSALAFLQRFADANGYYLQKYSIEVSEFLSKIAKSLNCHVYELRSMTCRVCDIVRFVRANNHVPDIPSPSQNAKKMLEALHPEYYWARNRSVIQNAESERRNKPKVISCRTESFI